MIAVPTHAATDVQENFRHEAQHRRNFIRHVFRRVIMTGVEADERLILHGVAEIKLMHTHRVAFRTDAEEFAFDGVEVVFRLSFFLKTASSDCSRRSRGLRRSAGVSFMPSGIQTLVTVGEPVVLPIAAPISRLALAMFNPELADALVMMRECETARGLGMREARWVEIEPDALGLGPINPVLEMLRLDFVAVHFLAAELAVKRVQVQTMLAGDEGERPVEVGAEFVGRAGFAGIISRGHNAAGERAAEILEAADVVALPAVERDGDFGELLEDGVGVDPEGGIAFAGKLVGGGNLFGVHRQEA